MYVCHAYADHLDIIVIGHPLGQDICLCKFDTSIDGLTSYFLNTARGNIILVT